MALLACCALSACPSVTKGQSAVKSSGRTTPTPDTKGWVSGVLALDGMSFVSASLFLGGVAHQKRPASRDGGVRNTALGVLRSAALGTRGANTLHQRVYPQPNRDPAASFNTSVCPHTCVARLFFPVPVLSRLATLSIPYPINHYQMRV